MASKDNTKYIIGIDEVGRGPIAGPVAVCVFLCINHEFEIIIKEITGKLKLPIRDSKKLTKNQRNKWFQLLNEEKDKGNCDFAVSFVSSENIDKFGISRCIQKALNESLDKIVRLEMFFERSSDVGGRGARPFPKTSPASFCILLDGGLKAPKEFVNQETIIKGDELHPVISLASIVAKVSRDKVMETFAKKYPWYGFDKNSGYGTKAHYEAIKKYGITEIHRKSFIH